MQNMKLGSIMIAGIMASAAVILFMLFVPPILGMNAIDIAKEVGTAFSSNSPHTAGVSFLALISIVWAAVFGVAYPMLPGTTIIKGAVFGLIVGAFSVTVLPTVITVLDGIFGAANQYTQPAMALDVQLIMTLAAYVVFGIILATTCKPEIQGNRI